MSNNFNHIEYRNFEDNPQHNTPIYRKLKIIDRSNDDNNIDYASNIENQEDNEVYCSFNDRINENMNDINSEDSNEESNFDNKFNSESMKTVDLNSTMPYRKSENRYYDSLTNTSFNDIRDFNRLNEIKLSGKKERLIMEIDDSKNILRSNIQKVYERDNYLDNLNEKSKNLLDGADKFKKTSKYLKRKMYLNYLCHSIAVILGVLIVILFLYILIK